MGSGSSRTNVHSNANVEEEVKILMEKMIDEAGLATPTVDDVMSRLEAAMGVSLQGKRDLIDRHLQTLLGEENVKKKFLPHIRELVREAKFGKLTRKDCLKKLEPIYGFETGRFIGLIGRILDEEQRRYLLEDGKRISQTPYVLGETLGKGHYGLVKRAMNPDTGRAFAIKMISTEHLETQYSQQQLRREIEIMKTLVHENVLHLIEVIETPQFVYLVLELVDGGELFEYSAPPNKIFPETLARGFFQQLIMGVLYCHRRGIAHRDLKPANLLVNSAGVLKVSDFGLSAFQKTSDSGNVHESMQLKTCCGSPKYIAPEVVADQGYNGFIADVWSCGVILYLMLAGRAPFEHRNVTGLLKKVMVGKYDMPEFFPQQARNLISRMLVVQPDKRITIKDVIAHPWFQVDFDNSKFDMVMQATQKVAPVCNDPTNLIPPSSYHRSPPSPGNTTKSTLVMSSSPQPGSPEQHPAAPAVSALPLGGMRTTRSSIASAADMQALVDIAEGRS